MSFRYEKSFGIYFCTLQSQTARQKCAEWTEWTDFTVVDFVFHLIFVPKFLMILKLHYFKLKKCWIIEGIKFNEAFMRTVGTPKLKSRWKSTGCRYQCNENGIITCYSANSSSTRVFISSFTIHSEKY